ncbi:site-specific integrase [Maritalea porphyrae]|jgi:integrase|uniref:site-specific integrase n=1 Tax=Maritalea porphyrae TaxID=880732 RepID=UPI0022B06835|nr:site-specific integrase [Maritalea porphyrae]MCZ4271980.1 tyrosine-type recombinase/integrase [Maritalea porphyrae]
MPVTSLTRVFVRKCKCPQDKQKIIYSDSRVKGLVLEARNSGGKTYYVRYRDHYGDQRNIKIGDAGVIDLDAARQRTIEVMSKVALGEDPHAERKAMRQVPMFDTFFAERYLPFVKGYKRSWKSDESLYRNHIAPVFGRQRMDAVTTADISKFHHGLCALGYAPGSANRVLILLRYMYNLAAKWQVAGLEKNPSAGVELFRLNNEKQRFLTMDEVNQLFVEIRRSPNRALEPIVSLLLLTGARKREVLDAQWADFDFNNRIWIIPITKSGKARKMPLSDEAIELLCGLKSKGKSVYLFPNPETAKPFRTIFYAWDTARKRAGLADVRMHDLRHSFASFLVNSGRSLYEVQRLLGHAHIKTTERYAHLSDETLSSAVNVVGSILKSA